MSRWKITSKHAQEKRKIYWAKRIKEINESDQMPSDKQLLKALAAEVD